MILILFYLIDQDYQEFIKLLKLVITDQKFFKKNMRKIFIQIFRDIL